MWKCLHILIDFYFIFSWTLVVIHKMWKCLHISIDFLSSHMFHCCNWYNAKVSSHFNNFLDSHKLLAVNLIIYFMHWCYNVFIQRCQQNLKASGQVIYHAGVWYVDRIFIIQFSFGLHLLLSVSNWTRYFRHWSSNATNYHHVALMTYDWSDNLYLSHGPDNEMLASWISHIIHLSFHIAAWKSWAIYNKQRSRPPAMYFLKTFISITANVSLSMLPFPNTKN